MPENQPILPALKPHDWPARDDALCRPILTARDVPAVPWVGYGYQHNNAFEFLSQETFPSGNPADHIRMIEQAAIRNLRERPVSHKIEMVRLGRFPLGRRMKLLIFSDDFLAAEHILDPVAMQSAAKQLKARRIAVGTPCRGVLVATNARQSKKLLSHFAAMVADQYYKAHTAPISPVVFIIEQGRVIGAMTEISTRASPAAHRAGKESSPSIAQDDSADIYLNVVISADRQTGREILHLLAGGPDFNRLEQALIPAFSKSIEPMLSRPEFSGRVRIILIPDLTPRTSDLEKHIERLRAQIQATAGEIGLFTQSGAPVEISVMYGIETDQPVPIQTANKPAAETSPSTDRIDRTTDTLLTANSTEIYHQMLAALRDLGHPQTDLALFWLAEQADLQSIEPDVSQALTLALCNIVTSPPADLSPELRVLAIRALGKIAGGEKNEASLDNSISRVDSTRLIDPMIFNALVDALWVPDGNVQSAAEQALLDLGPAIGILLRATLRKLDPHTCPDAIDRLNRLLKRIEDSQGTP